MKRILWFCLFVLGLILSWTPVYAGDSNVIPVVKTGQTNSYRAHDDGDLKKGVAWPTPRFTNNNNGTVTDNLTGLIWLKNANCSGAMENWNTAIDYAAALYDGCTNCFGTGGDCGLSDGSKAGDWRLPNRNELLSLIDIAYYNPALSNVAGTGQWSEGNPFTDVQIVKCWSSSTNTSRPGIAGRLGLAWGVDFGNGNVGRHGKNSDNYVWCVRDGK